MKLRTALASLFLSLGTVLPAQLGFAHGTTASENVSSIARNNRMKMKMVNDMARRIKRHKRMTLDAIKVDLTSTARQNSAWIASLARSKGQEITAEQKSKLEAQIEKISTLSDKEAILDAEERLLSEAMSSEVFVFFCTRSFFDNPIGAYLSFLTLGTVPLFLLALDVVTFPFTIFLSAVSGF